VYGFTFACGVSSRCGELLHRRLPTRDSMTHETGTRGEMGRGMGDFIGGARHRLLSYGA